MLIGVLCEVISGVGAFEKEKSTVEFAKRSLEVHFESHDKDGDGMLDMEEFRKLVMVPEVKGVLEGMEIDPYVLDDMADVIFYRDSKYVRKSMVFPKNRISCENAIQKVRENVDEVLRNV